VRDAASPRRPCRADVVASYDHGVEAYENLWSPVILPAALALVPWLGVRDGGVVLDVGAGTGALVGAIRAAVSSAEVVALDASGEMLRVAHLQRHAPAVLADAQALPVAAETVDAAVLAYVLFHLADPLAALREATRVLRSGGRAATVTWTSERAEPAQVIWNNALAEAGIPTLSPRRIDTGLDSPGGIDELLREAGLVAERIWTEQLEHRWDRESFWALATGSGVNRTRLGLIEPEARSMVLARLRDELGRLGPEGYRWQGQVVCAVAIKPGSSTPRGRGDRGLPLCPPTERHQGRSR
jgi:SAM-dependent methyltransferase